MRVTNLSVTDCEVTVTNFALGNQAPHVNITNAPDGQPHLVLANGGTYEFDIEMEIESDSTATVPKRFSYLIQDVGCEPYQYLSVVPESETTWDTAAPPAGTGLSPLPYDGWDAGTLATGALKFWGATLIPTSSQNSFSGRTVQEFAPSNAIDYCWNADPNHTLPKAALTPGAPWTVQTDSYYASDRVGWYTDAVNYYRSIGAAPCSAVIPQRMSMLVAVYPSDTYYPPDGYRDQLLVWGVDRDCAFANTAGEVASQRDSACDSKQW